MQHSLLNSESPVLKLSRTLFLTAFALAITFNASAQLTGSINSTNDVTCFGGNDGAVDINVSGGTAPYSFLWSNGATTEDMSGLSAGSYSVTITDAAAGSVIVNANVIEPPALSVSKSVTDVSCNGGTDGEVNLIVSGGTPPYSFAWSNGASTEDITNQSSGPFSVTVADANGCNTLLIDTIGEPSLFFIVSTTSTPVSCFGGSDGSVSILVAGGILPYTFAWSNGATTEDLNNIPAGTYNLVATDNNGCKDYASVIVTQPATAITASFNVTNSTCYYSNDGAVDLTVSGGNPPYTYAWSNGSATEDLLGISAGNYSVTITDVKGCTNIQNPLVQALDIIAPIASCKSIDVFLDATGSASITGADLDNGSTDNCSLDSFAISKNSFSCADIGANTIEFVAFDSNGNSDTCAATVNVYDSLPPVIDAGSATLYLNANGQASLSVADIDNGTYDMCGLDTIMLDKYNYDCSDLGLKLAQITAIDDHGNTSIAFFTVWVRDTIAPEAFARDITVYLNQAGTASIVASDIDSASSDVCGIDSIYLDRNSFNCTDIGVQTVSLSVVDLEGNVSSANAQVTVLDNLAPQFTPANTNLYLDNTGNASIASSDVLTGLADNCALDTVTLDQYLFNCTGVGLNIVNITATDIYGNTNVQMVQVMVIDTNLPAIITKNTTVFLDQDGLGSINVSDVDSVSTAICGMDSVYLDRYNFSCTNLGLNTVNLIAVSHNGVQASVSAQVMVIDTNAPMVNTNNLTVYLDADGTASILPQAVDAGSVDECGVDSLYLNQQNFNCADLGPQSVDLTVFDAAGNPGMGSANIMVLDTISPSLTTQNITVYLDNNGQVTLNATTLIATSGDNCGSTSASVIPSLLSCTEIGMNMVTVTITDPSLNETSAMAEVTVMDTINPIVQAQDMTVYLNATGVVNITAAQVDAGSGTACGMDSLYITRSSFDCSDLGANTVILTGTKANGQSSSDTAIITVADTLGPLPTVSKLDLFLNAAGNASILDLSGHSYLSEPCGLDSVWFAQNAFTCADLGSSMVSFRAYDALGNITDASIQVVVHDTLAPIVGAQNISVYVDSTGSVNIGVSDVNQFASDVCGIDTIYLDRYSFNCSEVGLNSVVVTAVDLYGNIGVALAQVTVIDTVLPAASARNLTVYVDGNGQARITPAMVDKGSTDGNCSYNVILSDSVFDCAELGLNLEQLVIMDAAGNSDTADFFVTVLDTIKPKMVLRDITLSLDQTGNTFISDASVFDSVSTDNCANILSFAVTKTQYDCDDIGSHSVIITAEDGKLNKTTSSAWVHIVDNIAPVMAVKTATVYLDSLGTGVSAAASVDNGSYDACGIDSLWLDQYQFDVSDLGLNSVVLYARDANGNVSLAPATINVVDTLAPAISLQPVDLYLNANGYTALNGTIGLSDNHAVTSVNYGQIIFSCADTGSSMVSVTAQDPSGNIITGYLAVYVRDTLAPAVSGNNVSVYLDVTGNATLSMQDVNATGTDNCGIPTMSLSQTSFSCADLGTNNVQLFGTDHSNNTGSSNLIITVIDTVAPMLTNVPADTTVVADASVCGAQVTYSVPSVADVCGWTNFTSSHASGSFFGIGTTLVTFTLEDSSGNSVHRSFNITVVDNAPPQVISMPQTDTIGVCQAYHYYNVPVASDNCSATTVTQIAGIPSGGYHPVGSTINTYKISDANGNDTIVSFEVIVEPLGQPTLPNVLSVCENDDPIDFSQGQSVQWSGKGMSANLFDPATAGIGVHNLNYNFIDDNGCITTGTMTITVVPQPTKPAIKRIGSSTLTTGAFDYYQWYRDGQAIAGANAQTYQYSTGGNYQVMVTNVVSCSEYSDGFIVGASGGGIGLDEINLAQVSLYPNPSEGLITISLGQQRQEDLVISVHSISGQLIYQVMEKTGANGTVTIDLRNVPNAAYLVQIATAESSVTRKVILH